MTKSLSYHRRWSVERGAPSGHAADSAGGGVSGKARQYFGGKREVRIKGSGLHKGLCPFWGKRQQIVGCQGPTASRTGVCRDLQLTTLWSKPLGQSDWTNWMPSLMAIDFRLRSLSQSSGIVDINCHPWQSIEFLADCRQPFILSELNLRTATNPT